MIACIIQLWAHETVRQIGTAVITAIVTLLLTHAFDSRKLRKQQQIAFQDSLGNKIVDAYLKVREIILEIRSIEALPESIQYSLENKEKTENLLFYPAFMSDVQTMSEYFIKVSNARKQYEPYLSNKASAFLYILERYLLEVATFIGENKFQNATKGVGIFAHPDLQKIEKAFDDVIINEINKPRYYLESKNTKRYEHMKVTLKKKYIDNSMLMSVFDKDINQINSQFNSKNASHEGDYTTIS